MNALAVENLSHSFGNRQVLQNVSFTVAEGRMCILLGRNGAGKTTLFSLITGLYYARAGLVRVFDMAMQANPSAALAQFSATPDGVIVLAPAGIGGGGGGAEFSLGGEAPLLGVVRDRWLPSHPRVSPRRPSCDCHESLPAGIVVPP